MDIRNWSMDQILMLPDHCLSRRFVVSTSLILAGAGEVWDISELAFPDRAIVHELSWYGTGGLGKFAVMRLALGDQLPTAVAEMDRLEPLFHGLGVQGPEPRSFTIGAQGQFALNRLKMYVPAQGRRLVMEMVAAEAVVLFVCAAITVSAVPTEVPDCLLLV